MRIAPGGVRRGGVPGDRSSSLGGQGGRNPRNLFPRPPPSRRAGATQPHTYRGSYSIRCCFKMDTNSAWKSRFR